MGGDHFNLHWCHQSGFVELESSSHPHTCPSPWGDNGFFCVYVCFSHHLNNSNGWISQLCTSGLCLCFSFCFCLPHIDYKTTHPHQCCQFKSDVSRTLQHLLLTWPLQSSTLGPRCIHSHAETCAAQHKLELSLIPALHICFDAVSVVFLGGFSFSFFCYSYCRKACSPYDWASETASAHTLVLCFQSVLSCIHKVRTETARALHKTENNCPCMLHIPWSTVAGQRDKTCCLGNAPLK